MTVQYFGNQHVTKELFFQQLMDNPPPIIAIDTETISLKEKLPIGFAIAINPHEAWWFDCYPESDPEIEMLVSLMTNPNILKVYANVMFDIRVQPLIFQNFQFDESNIIDILVMARLLGRTHAKVADLATEIGRIIQTAEELLEEYGAKTMLEVPHEAVVAHCTTDATTTLALYHHFAPQMDSLNLSPDYMDVERQVIPILVDMSQRGLAINQQSRAIMEKRLEEDRDFYKSKCTELDFNPGSGMQTGYILAKRGNFLPFTRGKKQLKTDEDTLELLDDPLVAPILGYKRANSILTKYLYPLRDKDRIYTEYGLDTEVGRTKSSDFNMQNIPSLSSKVGVDVRHIFIPDSGTFTTGDFSQLHLRIIMFFSGDKEMERVYYDGADDGDIHVSTSKKIHKPRPIAKAVNYCIPMTTKVLTKAGWKDFEELGDNEWVMGYYEDRQQMGWTPIYNAYRQEKATLSTFGNRFMQLDSTSSHRWYGEQRRSRTGRRVYLPEVKTLNEFNSEFRIRLAAPANLDTFFGEAVSLTSREAAILAWVLCDGDKRLGCIFQSKPQYIEVIDELLSNVPHIKRPVRKDGLHTWKLSGEVWKSIREKTEHLEFSVLVSRLSDSARKAFLEAVIQAEGSHPTDRWGNKHLKITQNSGHLADAIRLAATLEGYYVHTFRQKILSGNICEQMSLSSPYMGMQQLQVFDEYEEAVWCLTTGSSSFLAKDIRGQVFLTGNIIPYGRDARVLATKLRTKDIKYCSGLIDDWMDAYPDAAQWLIAAEKYGLAHGKALPTLFGRQIAVPEEYTKYGKLDINGMKRKSTNYPVLGSDGEVLKRALILCNNHSLPLAVQVHDSITLDGDCVFPIEALESLAPVPTPFEVDKSAVWK